jgi:hypothetical protein
VSASIDILRVACIMTGPGFRLRCSVDPAAEPDAIGLLGATARAQLCDNCVIAFKGGIESLHDIVHELAHGLVYWKTGKLDGAEDESDTRADRFPRQARRCFAGDETMSNELMLVLCMPFLMVAAYFIGRTHELEAQLKRRREQRERKPPGRT